MKLKLTLLLAVVCSATLFAQENVYRAQYYVDGKTTSEEVFVADGTADIASMLIRVYSILDRGDPTRMNAISQFRANSKEQVFQLTNYLVPELGGFIQKEYAVSCRVYYRDYANYDIFAIVITNYSRTGGTSEEPRYKITRLAYRR